MAVETPATIAVIGAGPIGLEAALYGRFLGYDVLLFERGQVAENVLAWEHVEMFTPFSMNRSPLAVAALDAQGHSELPADDEILTGGRWRNEYLLPLAESDLLSGALHLQSSVVEVSRQTILKHELPGSDDRATSRFRILVDGPGGEAAFQADIVIDCSGVTSVPNFLGPGGSPAIGERALAGEIFHLPPDVLGASAERFRNKSTLLVGTGYSAATTATRLAQLAEQHPQTKFTWALRNEDGQAPIRRIPDDRLATRDQLAQTANALAAAADGPCTLRHASCIESIRPDEDGALLVRFYGVEKEQRFDNLVANVGFRGDTSITNSLQVHRCYASDGPMKLAAAIVGNDSGDCLNQSSTGAASLCTPEPNLYLLGSKSYGRNPNFLYSVGLEQIRDLFTLIGDRKSLNLYSMIKTSS